MSDVVLLSRDARGVATITLNRPEKRNAFDDALIRRLHDVINEVSTDATIRVVVLTGSGSAFSAGADLDHMRRQGGMSEEENYADALRFANCLQALDRLNKPVIARVNGGAYGGGIGLIACADIAIAIDTAKFALTEVRFGIVPAVISPYVIAAIGARHARRWFLTAAPVTAHAAQAITLLHEVVSTTQLDESVEATIKFLLQGGSQAHDEAKRLIRDITAMSGADEQSELPRHTAKLLARLRGSREGKEGLSAFLEGRPAAWIKP